VAAVLDWELSTLGHPLADLAYNIMPYRLGMEWDGFRGKDLAALGLPTEDAYVADYCRRVGRARIPDWDWYVVFAIFRLAASSPAPPTTRTPAPAASGPSPWPTPAGRSSSAPGLDHERERLSVEDAPRELAQARLVRRAREGSIRDDEMPVRRHAVSKEAK